MKDISNLTDIKVFVNAFYLTIQKDEMLGPVFAIRIKGEQWNKHLQRMYTFWNTVLFAEPGYKGSPFSKHIGLPVSKPHFDHWVALFEQTIDAHFVGPNAEIAKAKARDIAQVFSFKMDYLAKNSD